MTFFDEIEEGNKRTGNCLCVGIDFREGEPFFQNELKQSGIQKTLLKFSDCLILSAAKRVASVKFQSAFFEKYGAEGISALKEAIHLAKRHGLLAILDAKRSDISSTMVAYGEFAFSHLKADALTVVPFFGVKSLSVLNPWLKNGKGIFIIWISSNPEAASIQNPIKNILLDEINTSDISQSAGFVLGATKVSELSPTELACLRKRPLLLPGVGAQNASLAGLKSFINAKNLVPVSRGISEISPSALGSWLDLANHVSEKVEEYVQKLSII